MYIIIILSDLVETILIKYFKIIEVIEFNIKKNEELFKRKSGIMYQLWFFVFSKYFHCYWLGLVGRNIEVIPFAFPPDWSSTRRLLYFNIRLAHRCHRFQSMSSLFKYFTLKLKLSWNISVGIAGNKSTYK